MSNPVSDFMSNWLNSTYKYLKESGGGPTYPTTKVTVGPGVLPIGGYSLVEDYPVTYDIPAIARTVPLPFNPNATGIPATANSQGDAIEEIAKGSPTPSVLSSNFQRLYPNLGMNACIADQKHGKGNPNAEYACQQFAAIGDVSDMILWPAQAKNLGLTPPSQENAKSDEVRLAEEKASLTGQIKTGVNEAVGTWKGFAAGTGALLSQDPSGNKTTSGDPAGNNFQAVGDKLKAFIPSMPTIPDLNSPIILIGGAVVLVVLLIAIVK